MIKKIRGKTYFFGEDVDEIKQKFTRLLLFPLGIFFIVYLIGLVTVLNLGFEGYYHSTSLLAMIVFLIIIWKLQKEYQEQITLADGIVFIALLFFMGLFVDLVSYLI